MVYADLRHDRVCAEQERQCRVRRARQAVCEHASHASFNSQISQVFKVPGKRDLYIALADRWVPDYPVDAKLADLLERCTAQRFDPEHYKATSEEMQTMMQSPMLTSANTSRANYVWLPITFEEGKPKIHWRDSWKLSDFE